MIDTSTWICDVRINLFFQTINWVPAGVRPHRVARHGWRVVADIVLRRVSTVCAANRCMAIRGTPWDCAFKHASGVLTAYDISAVIYAGCMIFIFAHGCDESKHRITLNIFSFSVRYRSQTNLFNSNPCRRDGIGNALHSTLPCASAAIRAAS
jgi:hypothetical protein